MARAVVHLADAGGAKGITARALAGHLHVSVGALYNYAGSMQKALAAGEEVLTKQLLADLNQTAGEDPIESLAQWAQSHAGLASYFFDPSRPHRASPEMAAWYGPYVGSDPEAAASQFEDMRMVVGIMTRNEPRSESASVLNNRLIELQKSAARNVGNSDGIEILPSLEAIDAELVAQVEKSTDSEKLREVRLASARLMLNPDEQWNFRRLSDGLGIALAALHSLGSRNEHIRQACVNIVCAFAVAASRTVGRDQSSVDAATLELMATIGAPMFQDLTSVIDSGLLYEFAIRVQAEPELDEVRLPLAHMSMMAAMLVAAYHDEDRDLAGTARNARMFDSASTGSSAG